MKRNHNSKEIIELIKLLLLYILYTSYEDQYYYKAALKIKLSNKNQRLIMYIFLMQVPTTI